MRFDMIEKCCFRVNHPVWQNNVHYKTNTIPTMKTHLRVSAVEWLWSKECVWLSSLAENPHVTSDVLHRGFVKQTVSSRHYVITDDCNTHMFQGLCMFCMCVTWRLVGVSSNEFRGWWVQMTGWSIGNNNLVSPCDDVSGACGRV